MPPSVSAIRDDSVRAIVIIGAGRTFIAGADIKGLEQLAWGSDSGAPEMHELLQKLEDAPKPVVMAMHGTALGGGLEVAMAGHYRVAVPDAQMGQPEVNLGIIPGAEGTQRLPRLVGLEKAIEMCVSGKPIKAADALSAGLIDRIIEGDLATGRAAFAREMAARSAAAPEDARAARQTSARRGAPGHARRRARARAQDTPSASKRLWRSSTRSKPRRRCRLTEGCAREREIFFDSREVRAGQGAHPRLLRRAGCLEGARHLEGHRGRDR